MSIYLIEKYASREGNKGRNESDRYMYTVMRSIDQAEVYDALFHGAIDENGGAVAGAPTVNENGMYAQSAHAAHVGGGVWECSVDYGLVPQLSLQDLVNPDAGNGTRGADPLPPNVRFRASGTTQHVTQSLYTVAKAKKTADARPLDDYKGAIAVSNTGVQGTDIIVPSLTWQESWTFLAPYATWGQQRRWSDLIGRTNKAKFRHYDPGEVRVEDIDGDQFGSAQRNVVFSFRRQPNVTDFKLTPAFDPVDKKGFDFLWVAYERAAGAAGLPMVPRAVYVERTGRPGLTDDDGNPTNDDNFDLLGIGS